MRRFSIICLCSTLLGWGPSARTETGQETVSECVEHSLELAEVRERIQRWSGLKAFARWKVRSSKLAPCSRDGTVLLHLQIAPPDKWSLNDLPYRVWLTIPLDGASGTPRQGAPEAFGDLAAGVKRMTARAERYEDVRRFVERFGVGRAEIDKTAEQGRYKVTYVAESQPGQSGPRLPSITYDESAPDRITAYRIPRMDSLPVRREMLRMLEVLSSQHPHCRPRWIDATRHQLAGPEVQPIRWRFVFELEGASCPARFAANLEPDGAVARLGAIGAEPTAKGDAPTVEPDALSERGDGDGVDGDKGQR